MLTPGGKAVVTVAALVGVVGWPVLAAVGYAWLTRATPTDPLWWVAGVLFAATAYLQLTLSRALWPFLDWRRR
jgi:RsiW-degrading membrane proteinase PrsW (M82 family)